MSDFKFNVSDVLEGKVAAPVMPGPNPHPLWTTEWFAWKEQNESYKPYHVGTDPNKHCGMPRVVVIRPGVYRCPSCGKEFPTATARLAARKV